MKTQQLEDILARDLEELGLDLEPARRTTLIKYFNMLAAWNRKIRLVGSAARPRDFSNLVGDSLAVLLVLDPDPGKRLIDVGSGAGLPGLVLAIARPELEVVSVEPIHKKVAFQRAVRRDLGVGNHRAESCRIEEHPDRDFDAAVSRAAFDLGDWMRMGATLVRPGGQVIGLANPGQADEASLDVKEVRYELAGRSRVLLVKEPVGC